MKEYGYTLYTNTGKKIRGTVTSKNESIANSTVKEIENSRQDVEFATIDSLDMPCDYDWDEECKAWQSKMF